MNDITLSDLEKTFYSDGYKLAMEAGENGLTGNSVFAATARLYRIIDEMVNSLWQFAENNAKSPHCFKGCSFCCFQPVFASSHEIRYLSKYLRNNLAEDQIEKLVHKASEKNERLKTMKKFQLFNSKFPCPLLHEGACFAYEARPVSCRIYLSTDVESCERFFSDPEDKNSIPNLMEFSLRTGRMLNEGFLAGLRIQGYQSREFRIEEGLLEEIQ